VLETWGRAPMSIWRLREMRNQAVTPIMQPTQMEPMLSHMTCPVKCTSVVHSPAGAGAACESQESEHLLACAIARSLWQT